MSRPATFISIPIRRWPFLRLICTGPSTIVTSAISRSADDGQH